MCTNFSNAEITNKLKEDRNEIYIITARYLTNKDTEDGEKMRNTVKYRKSNDSKIIIFAEEKQEKVILYIKDNGIGLFLCKKLCDKLRLGIELNSNKNIGTEIKIIFPKGSFSNI